MAHSEVGTVAKRLGCGIPKLQNPDSHVTIFVSKQVGNRESQKSYNRELQVLVRYHTIVSDGHRNMRRSALCRSRRAGAGVMLFFYPF